MFQFISFLLKHLAAFNGDQINLISLIKISNAPSVTTHTQDGLGTLNH